MTLTLHAQNFKLMLKIENGELKIENGELKVAN